MHAEDLVVDHDAQGEEVEHVGEIVPDISVAVFSGTLSIKSVGLGYAAGFMVSSDEMDTLRVS